VLGALAKEKCLVDGNVPMSRLCVPYPGICFPTEEDHGEIALMKLNGAQLIGIESDTLSRRSQRGRWSRLDFWPLPLFAFKSADEVYSRSANVALFEDP